MNCFVLLKCQNKLHRCLQFAISLGGDTDTIAAMAGAISGAQVGEDGLPEPLLRHCEAVKDVISWADKLFEMSQNSELKSSKVI